MVTTVDVKDAAGTTRTVNTLPALGSALTAAALPVAIASDQTVPVSLASVPSHAVTNAGTFAVQVTSAPSTAVTNAGTFAVQAAITSGGIASGTTGSPSTDILTVQGNASGVAIPVSVASIPSHAVTNAGVFAVQPSLTASANGLTSSRVVAAASTNATSLKASAGNLASIDVFNVAAYDVFLKFYNKASAPTVGTDTPVWTIPIKTGTGYSARFPVGKSFATGIAYAITKLQADTDTTALVAGDVTGSIDWI